MSKLIANCKMKEPASKPASSRVTCHRSPAATALGCVSPDSSKASESIGSVNQGNSRASMRMRRATRSSRPVSQLCSH